MSYELRKHKKSDAIKWIVVFVLILALIAGMLAMFTGGFKNWDVKTWFGQTETECEHEYVDGKCSKCGEDEPAEPATPPVVDESGNAMDGDKVYPMPERMAFSPLQYNAVAETYSTSSVTVSATIEPADATNQGVNWSVAFKNPSSKWANGKSVSSYISLEPSEKTVVVTCRSSFGEQIILTAASAENPDIKATCTIDYVKPLGNISLYLWDSVIAGTSENFTQTASEASFSIGFYDSFIAEFGEGTVGGVLNVDNVAVDFDSDFTDLVGTYTGTYDYTYSQKTVTSESDFIWAEADSFSIDLSMDQDFYSILYGYILEKSTGAQDPPFFVITYTFSSVFYGERTAVIYLHTCLDYYPLPYVSVTGITIDGNGFIVDSSGMISGGI